MHAKKQNNNGKYKISDEIQSAIAQNKENPSECHTPQ